MTRSNKVVLGALTVAAILYGGTKPPVVVEQGIKITQRNIEDNQVTLQWSTTDERIVVGEDSFRVLKKIRQIPARTGWSDWVLIGETIDTNFIHKCFMRGEDCIFKIQVDKGAINEQ